MTFARSGVDVEASTSASLLETGEDAEGYADQDVEKFAVLVAEDKLADLRRT